MSWIAIFLESSFILPERDEELNFVLNFKDFIFKMVIPSMIKKHGYNPNNVQTDEQIIKEMVEMIFDMVLHATFERITEENSRYKITFVLSNKGKLYFKTILNLPSTHRGETFFQKIDPYETYRSIVQPDATLLPDLIEYYLRDIINNLDDYLERNKE